MQGLFALSFHALCVASDCRGLLMLLVTDPQQLRTNYLPAMPWDEVYLVMDALAAQRLTWYRCPNGHLYSVGECGGPMVTGKCSHPGCSSVVGGHAHVPAKGNRRLGTVHELRAQLGSASPLKPGYHWDGSATRVYKDVDVRRTDYVMKRETLAFLRLLMHLLLLAGIDSKGGNMQSLHGLCPQLSMKDLVQCIEADWLALKESPKFDVATQRCKLLI